MDDEIQDGGTGVQNVDTTMQNTDNSVHVQDYVAGEQNSETGVRNSMVVIVQENTGTDVQNSENDVHNSETDVQTPSTGNQESRTGRQNSRTGRQNSRTGVNISGTGRPSLGTPTHRLINHQYIPRSNIALCISCIFMVIVFAVFAILTVFFPIIGWMLAFPLVFIFLIVVRHLTACIAKDGRVDRMDLERSYHGETEDNTTTATDHPPSYEDALSATPNGGNNREQLPSTENGLPFLPCYVNENYEPDQDEPPPPTYDEALRLKELEEIALANNNNNN